MKEKKPIAPDQPTSQTKADPAQKPPGRKPTASVKSADRGVSLPRSRSTRQSSDRRTSTVTPTVTTPKDLEEVLPAKESQEELIAPVSAENTDLAPQAAPPRRGRRAERQRKEEGLSTAELIQKRTGLSGEDLELILELGYEAELEGLVGTETIKRLKSEYLSQTRSAEQDQYRTAFGYRGEESIHSAEVVIAAYQRDRKRHLLRLLPTVLLSLLLFMLEIALPAIALLPTGWAEALDAWNKPIAMGLFTLCAALSLRSLAAGARSLLRFSPTPYSVAALLTPIVLVYDAFSLFVKAELLAVNFAASLVLLALAVADLLRLCTELRTVRLLDDTREPSVLAEVAPQKKKMRRGNQTVRIVTELNDEPHYRICRTAQTVGFFRRCNDFSSAARPFATFLITAAALSVLTAVLTALKSESLAATASAFMASLLTTMPTAACFAYFYAPCRANRILMRRGCALIGEESVCEFGENKTVIFRDEYLYTAEKTAQLSVRHGDDLRTDIRLASALFCKLGGALAAIGNTPAGRTAGYAVSIVRILGGGAEAMVDGHHVLIGDTEFLQKSGVRVPKESTDAALRRGENTTQLFVAIDGVLKLCYEIQYQTNPSFESLIRDLADSATAVSILSYDPGINDSFLQKTRPASAEHVGIVKPTRFEEDTDEQLCDTGAIAGTPLDLVYPLHAAASVRALRQFYGRIQLIAALIGAAGIALYTLFSSGAMLPPILPALYQGFWLAITAIAARTELTPDKLHFKKQ